MSDRDHELTDPSRWARVAGRGGGWLGIALVLTIGVAIAFVYRSTARVQAAQNQAKELQRRYEAAASRLEAERQELEGHVHELENANQKLTQERDELAATKADLTEALDEKGTALRKLKSENAELKKAAAAAAKKKRRRR